MKKLRVGSLYKEPGYDSIFAIYNDFNNNWKVINLRLGEVGWFRQKNIRFDGVIVPSLVTWLADRYSKEKGEQDCS